MPVRLNGHSQSVAWTLMWLHTAAGDLLAAPTNPARTAEIASQMRTGVRQLARLLEVRLDG